MSKKTIAIVGAGPGLGLSIAKRFGREGFRVALVSRNRAKLEPLVAELKDAGIEAAAFTADVTNPGSIAKAFDEIKAKFGTVDVLEYSPITIPADPAGFAALDVKTMTPEFASEMVSTMAIGAVAAVQKVLPDMLQQKEGVILITMGASAKGFMPMTGGWGIAGAAARNYARTLHAAVKDQGVYVAAVPLGVQIQKGDANGDPDILAEAYYGLYRERKQPELFINHLPEGIMELDRG